MSRVAPKLALVDIGSRADQRRLTEPLKSVQASKKITWVKRSQPQKWSGQDFTSRGARGFFSVDFKDAIEVVKAAGVEQGTLKIQDSEQQRPRGGRGAFVLRLCGRLQNSLDEQQRAAQFRQLRASGPVLTDITDIDQRLPPDLRAYSSTRSRRRDSSECIVRAT